MSTKSANTDAKKSMSRRAKTPSRKMLEELKSYYDELYRLVMHVAHVCQHGLSVPHARNPFRFLMSLGLRIEVLNAIRTAPADTLKAILQMPVAGAVRSVVNVDVPDVAESQARRVDKVKSVLVHKRFDILHPFPVVRSMLYTIRLAYRRSKDDKPKEVELKDSKKQAKLLELLEPGKAEKLTVQDALLELVAALEVEDVLKKYGSLLAAMFGNFAALVKSKVPDAPRPAAAQAQPAAAQPAAAQAQPASESSEDEPATGGGRDRGRFAEMRENYVGPFRFFAKDDPTYAGPKILADKEVIVIDGKSVSVFDAIDELTTASERVLLKLEQNHMRCADALVQLLDLIRANLT